METFYFKVNVFRFEYKIGNFKLKICIFRNKENIIRGASGRCVMHLYGVASIYPLFMLHGLAECKGKIA